MIEARRAKYFERDGKIVCSSPRCASTTMAVSLDQRWTDFTSHQTAETVDFEGKEVLMWLRHPFERLESTKKIFRSLSPEIFGSQLLRRYDPHWEPQIDLHSFNGIFVPTTVMRFDTLMETWPQHFPDVKLERPLRQQPVVQRELWHVMAAAMPADMVAAIEAKYAADLALWESLS